MSANNKYKLEAICIGFSLFVTSLVNDYKISSILHLIAVVGFLYAICKWVMISSHRLQTPLNNYEWLDNRLHRIQKTIYVVMVMVAYIIGLKFNRFEMLIVASILLSLYNSLEELSLVGLNDFGVVLPNKEVKYDDIKEFSSKELNKKLSSIVIKVSTGEYIEIKNTKNNINKIINGIEKAKGIIANEVVERKTGKEK